MVAAIKKRMPAHGRALHTSSALTGYFYDMYRPGKVMISPKKVIALLHHAGVKFVLMGTHGIGGWRSQPRATQDVDILVAKKDHARAVGVLHKAFPKMIVEDGIIATRFKDPLTKEPCIDLMKPLQDVYKMAFRFTHKVGDSHLVPDLEMALITKFAAMVSPYRQISKKIIDAGDFADIVETHQRDIDQKKLQRLADKVYAGGGREISKLIDDIQAGRPIVI